MDSNKHPIFTWPKVSHWEHPPIPESAATHWGKWPFMSHTWDPSITLMWTHSIFKPCVSFQKDFFRAVLQRSFSEKKVFILQSVKWSRDHQSKLISRGFLTQRQFKTVRMQTFQGATSDLVCNVELRLNSLCCVLLFSCRDGVTQITQNPIDTMMFFQLQASRYASDSGKLDLLAKQRWSDHKGQTLSLSAYQQNHFWP